MCGGQIYLERLFGAVAGRGATEHLDGLVKIAGEEARYAESVEVLRRRSPRRFLLDLESCPCDARARRLLGDLAAMDRPRNSIREPGTEACFDGTVGFSIGGLNQRREAALRGGS